MSTGTKKPAKPRGWRSITSTTVEERLTGGVTKFPADYKPRQVVVTQLIDQAGAHWESYGGEPYRFIGWAPPLPEPEKE